MLEKIFSFGKAREKQSDDTTDKYRTITEEEYQKVQHLLEIRTHKEE